MTPTGSRKSGTAERRIIVIILIFADPGYNPFLQMG
jgi:hypothetical protein